MQSDSRPDHADDDKLHEECAIFGIWDATGAAKLTALGLHALQHRGQEASGIVSYDRSDARFYSRRGRGQVERVFGSPERIEGLKGGGAIGHNRYATTGEDMMSNIQPMFAEFAFGGFAVAHNGNLTNALKVRERLVSEGSIFQSTSDTEVIIHLIARSLRTTLVERVIDALMQMDGAYSLVALSPKKLIGVRDPMGVRPLAIGRLKGAAGSPTAYALASESCAFDMIGAEFIREVEPGELIVIDEDGLTSRRPFPQSRARPCIFEHIYFARPDSIIGGLSIYESRKRIGSELARESHPPGGIDVIVPVPDSGVPAAIGYAAEAGVPFELGIVRSHYVGRTFIQPTQSIRDLGVRMKHSANAEVLRGKRVVLVDDSIVRGTTSAKIVDMVRRAGAKEVHMRISSPPTTHPCFYGIDTPDRSELLAARHSVVEDMAKEIQADSLAFVSTDGLYRAMGELDGRSSEAPQYCDACFTGDYPTRLIDSDSGLIGAPTGRPIEQAAE